MDLRQDEGAIIGALFSSIYGFLTLNIASNVLSGVLDCR
ncbi:hypothetical protein CHCC20327_1925 [Bacillus licheniformis]|nr:hypothetical protein CHCC20487_4021 [Bacillus licheniformis]TWK90548.1 hypothetical protein CHCC20327_1925 [Bacillus licheniformis]